MQDAQPVIRFRWIPILLAFAGIAFIATLAIERIGRAQTPAPTAPPATVGPLVPIQVGDLGVSLLAPDDWESPVVLDANQFVLSPDGSSDTRTTAGPFLFVVIDALDVFKQRLTFRTDLSDPIAQLDALTDALNRNGPKFGAAQAYNGSPYPGAIVRGFERGNELTMILLRADSGRWVYVGAQARENDFARYERDVFLPVTNALRLEAR